MCARTAEEHDLVRTSSVRISRYMLAVPTGWKSCTRVSHFDKQLCPDCTRRSLTNPNGHVNTTAPGLDAGNWKPWLAAGLVRARHGDNRATAWDCLGGGGKRDDDAATIKLLKMTPTVGPSGWIWHAGGTALHYATINLARLVYRRL